jgi:hypothetical protein
VFASWHNTLVLSSKNKIMICGDNKYGQLGMKDKKEGF